ncbi:MAG: type II secretion system protein [Epsilonproteobacteria bacterium]|nr:type II secretion system protein [Campylobacterota bacterium]
MERRGFTMLELIFVIVVIGILASIALPRINATRTDAKISALSKQINSAIKEIGGYVTATGINTNEVSIVDQSKVLRQMIAKNQAKKDSATKVEIYGDDTTTCITLETNKTDLMVYSNPNANGSVCSGIKELIKDANYSIAATNISL